MLFDLYDKGYLSNENILVRHYKEIGISENQLAIILIVMSLTKEKNKIYTPKEISKFMTIADSAIEKELTNLFERNLVVLKKSELSRNSIYDFSPIFNRIVYSIENNANNNVNKTDSVNNFVRNTFNIKFSNSENKKISSFIDNGVSIKEIFSSLTFAENIKSSSDIINLIEDLSKRTKSQFTRIDWVTDEY